MKSIQKIKAILTECKNGRYIFRGENRFYPKISSSLYRQYEKNILKIEKEIVDKARQHIRPNASNIEVLTELQHYGGNTALIDFTQNIFIALFFACDGNFSENGRIVQLNIDSIPEKEDINYEENNDVVMIQPAGKGPRVIFQSSVFIHSTSGFIDDHESISIDKNDKNLILNYLKEKFNISHETIYNDIQGFIRLHVDNPIRSGTLQAHIEKIEKGKKILLKKNTKRKKNDFNK